MDTGRQRTGACTMHLEKEQQPTIVNLTYSVQTNGSGNRPCVAVVKRSRPLLSNPATLYQTSLHISIRKVSTSYRSLGIESSIKFWVRANSIQNMSENAKSWTHCYISTTFSYNRIHIFPWKLEKNLNYESMNGPKKPEELK